MHCPKCDNEMKFTKSFVDVYDQKHGHTTRDTHYWQCIVCGHEIDEGDD
jgi:uncharacterized C2H2 Zn-finger protein